MAGSATASAASSVVPLSPKSLQEMTEKLRSLKRHFEELDEEYGSDGNRSDERNVRMREQQDYIRAEIKEIEARIQPTPDIPCSPSKSTKVKQDSTVSRAEGDEMNRSRHTSGSLSKAAISSRTRASGQSTATASSNGSPNSNLLRGRLSGGGSQTPGNQSTSRLPSVNGNGSSRSSQRITARKSQRQVSGASSSIAAVAAAAAQAEAAATAVETTHRSSPPQQDVPMTEATVQQTDATTTDLVGSGVPSLLSAPSAFPNFGHPPSMESIVRVAEAAVAAQNAAKLAIAGPSQQDADVDPNLDPSLIAESSSSSTPSSKATATNANKPPPVDTTSTCAKTNDGTSSATPSSASSSLSNNPYLALATNYQRGGGTSPTGHPMFFPYPVFYPSPTTPVTPGSPAYSVPYNPYYYLAPPLVTTPNGVFSPPPQSQQSSPPPQATQQNSSLQGDLTKVVKSKRLKTHTVTTKSFSIPMVPRDKKGQPMLPLNVGIMTVIGLGTVCMRDHFHTERYIFPVGYEVTRRYLSTIDPSVEVVYHCTILDGGDGPKFQIIPSDRPDKPVIAGTATGAWSSIVKQANATRNRQHSNSVSGPDFFGLGQNTIKHLIQELPNADKLKDYVWQNFVEGGPLGGRHAAVIPALPEEYDASLPVGAYYPRRNEILEATLPRGLSYYPQHIIAQAEAQAKVAQNHGQADSVAGPSRSGTSASASPSSASPSPSESQLPQEPQTTVTTMAQLTTSAGSRNLLIHEYRPVQPPSQGAQPQAQKKRVTRSSTAAASTSGSASTNTRQSRLASKSQKIQKQAQPQPAMSASAPVNSDGGTPMTFAGIMKAFSRPHITLSTGNPNSTGS